MKKKWITKSRMNCLNDKYQGWDQTGDFSAKNHVFSRQIPKFFLPNIPEISLLRVILTCGYDRNSTKKKSHNVRVRPLRWGYRFVRHSTTNRHRIFFCGAFQNMKILRTYDQNFTKMRLLFVRYSVLDKNADNVISVLILGWLSQPYLVSPYVLYRLD